MKRGTATLFDGISRVGDRSIPPVQDTMGDTHVTLVRSHYAWEGPALATGEEEIRLHGTTLDTRAVGALKADTTPTGNLRGSKGSQSSDGKGG